MGADPRDIIKRPVITEHSTALMAENKYTFEVDPRANKYQIKQAIEEIFGVTVVKVNTMRLKGKVRRMGMTEGRQPERKRAIVTLKPGDRIEFFEGV